MNILQQHLLDHQISQRAFALQVGVSPSIISRLVKRAIRPGLDLAARIERETGGQVKAVSWVDQRPGVATPDNEATP